MQQLTQSFTAAGIFPAKLLTNIRLMSVAKVGMIPPLHIQLFPTNKCNLNCPICSCSERDKEESLSLAEIGRLIEKVRGITQAVTITGGGEPLMHPDIEDIIQLWTDAGIKVGLVTNGTMLGRIDANILNRVIWLRVSHADNRSFNGGYATMLSTVVESCPAVDWAFSYVVTNKVSPDIVPLINFANKHNFTHIRLVADLRAPDKADFDGAFKLIKKAGLDESRIIYQPRKDFVASQECYICYLKPTIAANGKIYACCGAQYALKKPSLNMPEELCVGDIDDMEGLANRSVEAFKTNCVRCYYQEYNTLLKMMVQKYQHEEFV